jgi:predicted ATPase with chaperone activity
VARSVADLAGEAEVGPAALAEALDFRWGAAAPAEGVSESRQG